MSGISVISRDYGIVPSIVRVLTSDTLATVSGGSYILNQAANISAANEGAFTWLSNDSVLVNASDGSAFYTISSDFNSLIPLDVVRSTFSLTAAQINGMYAAPILLVPAPPAGMLILPGTAVLNVVYGSAQFASGGAIALQYKNTVDGGGTLATGTIAAATLNGVTANDSLIFPAASSILSANAVAQPLYLSNQTGAFTTGTGATANLTVTYRLITAS